jgi:methyl-accepting chemotaxis protein
MFGWFYGTRTRTKLFLGFGSLILLVGAIALVGALSLRTMSRYLTELHDDHYKMSVTLTETQAKLNGVRAHLLTMAMHKDRAIQEREHNAIRALTKEIDANFDQLLASNLSEETKTKVRKVREPWEEFRNTRDSELIPFIYNGKVAEAQALALGIQRERYGRFASGAAEIVKDSQEQAYRFKQNGDERYRTSLAIFLVGCGVAVLLGVFLTIFYTRIIARPLVVMVDVVEKVSRGDLTVSVEGKTRDEVGQLGDAMRRMVEKLRNALLQVQLSATQVASASQQLSASSEELSAGAQEQASSLEETAASLEEITSTVKQNAENAEQANGLSIGSRDTAEKGGQVVRQAVEAMQEINSSSRRITDIISTIDEIAFQTNLLALNAAVEAARAGEQGRGFAVVAGEVRNLSQRSAAASKEIKGLIQDSVKKIEVGGDLVNRSGQNLDQIVSSVRRVTDLMAEIAATSQEQSTGINQVNRAVAQMDVVVQQNSAQMEELSSTAQVLADQAGELQSLINQFRLGNDGAMAHVPVASSRRAAPARKPATNDGAAKGQSGADGAAHPRTVVAVHPVSRHDREFKEF